jgi:hypothetical protein
MDGLIKYLYVKIFLLEKEKSKNSENLVEDSQDSQFTFSDSPSSEIVLSKVFSAFNLFEYIKKQPVIVTLIEDLDIAFGGGIQAGCITEFCL